MSALAAMKSADWAIQRGLARVMSAPAPPATVPDRVRSDAPCVEHERARERRAARGSGERARDAAAHAGAMDAPEQSCQQRGEYQAHHITRE